MRQKKFIYLGFLIALIAVSRVWFYHANKPVLEQAKLSLNNETKLPDFIDRWYITDNQFHIILDQYYIWEEGDEGGDTYFNVQDTLEIEVDGIPIAQITIAEATILIGRFDEDKNLLGSHGGNLDTSFPINRFFPGMHRIDVSLETTKGRILGHRWNFILN